MRKVKDLIEALVKFDPDSPVCIRLGSGEGYFSDWVMHEPNMLYPGDKVCLTAFEQFDDDENLL